MKKASPRYEFDSKPASGETQQIAPGVHWLRMPLPFALDHINLWLFEDGDNWGLVDTGLGDAQSIEHWRRLFATTMNGQPLSRVLVTHMHPDHVGCAGFLTEHFDVDLWMTRDEYLLCRVLVADTGREAPPEGVDFYRAAGYSDDALARYRKMFGMFGKFVTTLPESYQRLQDFDKVQIGDHQWEVIVGKGHSPEHACFYNAEQDLFVAGDQVLPSISANVSVYPTEPAANPLADWMQTLAAIRERIPPEVLVLPAHGKPFRGAHERIDQLIRGHEERLSVLWDFCDQPRRAVDVFPALYRRQITGDNLMFATGEALAHLNYLLLQGRLQSETDHAGVAWYQRT